MTVHVLGAISKEFSAFGDCRDLAKYQRSSCLMERGEALYSSKGCKQCHSLDGTRGTGPSFKGMWGQTRKSSDGKEAVVDEAFVRESLRSPTAHVRAGFSPVMPPFQNKLAERNLVGLLYWMETL